jgi:hypothetical protein
MLDYRRLWFATAALALALIAQSVALAQIAPPRTLDELKMETQARADRNGYPLTGLKPADVREALSNIHSLDPDEWARARRAGERSERPARPLNRCARRALA